MRQVLSLAAVILTLAMIQVFSAGERLSLWKVLL